MTFEPLIPGSLWLVLAAAGVAVLCWYAARRPAAVARRRFAAVVALMSAAFAVVLGLLLNPTWSRELPPPAGKPVLTVLLDTSGSMSTPDAAGSRYAAAAAVAGDMASALADQFDVRIRAFDQTLRRMDPAALATTTPDGAGTDLATAVNASLTEEHAQGQAVVLLSDGIDNAGGGTAPVLAAVRTARAMAAPIYTQTFGGDLRQVDLAVDVRSPQDMAVVNQKVPLSARVSAAGVAAVRADVTLLQGGREVARRSVLVGTDAPADVTFQLAQGKVGLYPYEVRVAPLPGEASQANNSAAYVLRVVNEPMRVLVVEGKPYWDSKFLTRHAHGRPGGRAGLLRPPVEHAAAAPHADPPRRRDHRRGASGGDDADRAETWQIDADASAVLGSPDRLRGYQVIVVGRDAEPFLTPAAVANLQDWVARQGGSLLCYRGSPTSDVDQRLAKLLPVRWGAAAPSRFRVALTTAGKDLNWFTFGAAGDAALPRLPSLAAADAIASEKPLAVVLATAVAGGGSAPAATVVYQQYGAGRVVVVEGSGMWRWAFLAPQYQGQEQVYATLWHSMLRWLTTAQGLTPGQTFSLRAEKVRFTTDEPATATLLARDDVPRGKLPGVRLTADGATAAAFGPPRTFAPAPVGSEAGVFRADFGKLPEGRYTARLAGDATAAADEPSAVVAFDVRRVDQEMMDLQARPDLMARIARDSGGAVLTTDSAATLRAAFAQHMARVQPPRVERTSAWDRWWLLVGVLGLWTASWFARRTGGLV